MKKLEAKKLTEEEKTEIEEIHRHSFRKIDEMSNAELKRVYANISYWGNDRFGQLLTESILQTIRFEMQRRENNRTTNITIFLTVIAVIVSAVSAIISALK